MEKKKFNLLGWFQYYEVECVCAFYVIAILGVGFTSGENRYELVEKERNVECECQQKQ